MRLRRGVVPAMAAVLVLGLVTGCSSDDPGREDDRSALPPIEELGVYFEAVASYDPELLAGAEQFTVSGSPAQQYVAYLTEFAESAIAAGQPVKPAIVEVGEETYSDGTYRACGGTGKPNECVTWANLEGEGGLLTEFTVDEVPLDDSLVDLTGQAPIESAGLYAVQPEYAYRSPQSDSLFVLVTVTAGDVPLSPRPGIYIEQDQILNGVETRSPATIDAGASSPVILAFPDAQDAALDGQVTFDLRIGGQDPESIGFGLTTPAA